jgi:glycosyltransferase involved in cell wall biosynthesis
MRGIRFVSEWLRLTNYLVSQKPDLIQFGKINFPFEAIFLAWLRWRGLILTQICHEFELRERQGGLATSLANQLYANVYNNFSVLFFHAENNRQRFLSLFQVAQKNTYIIPMGNENMFPASAGAEKIRQQLQQRYQINSAHSIVLFFGTITPSKGVTDLLHAFSLICPQLPQTRLVIAGFPTKHIDATALQQLTTDLGIAKFTVFDLRYLPIEEVGPLMSLARVVVYPYHNSTQSGALQVAYSFGKPVIATRVGGLPEAVEDGRSGFLVPPESPTELAKAIYRLMDKPELAEEMGAYARHLSETRYSWQPIAQQIITVYRDLID